MHMAWHSIDRSTFLKEGKMRNLVLLIATLLVSVFGFSTLSSSPSPAAEVVPKQDTQSADSILDEEFSYFACREKKDADAVVVAFRNGYDSARLLADLLVQSRRCDYVWEANFSEEENKAEQCKSISESKCYRVVKGTVNVIDEEMNSHIYDAYMLVQADGYPSEGPEFSNTKGLVWASRP